MGIPSAFLLHGYVGFIFGSIKANPWWSSPLMPVVFIFSAMVSGIAAVMLLYMLRCGSARADRHALCGHCSASYLFYIFIIDFSLEMLDLIHRIYEADESFRSLNFMVHTKLYFSHIVIQIVAGNCDSDCAAGIDSGCEALRLRAKTDLCRRRMSDTDRHLRNAMERSDRRTVVLEELSWIHDLQNGLRNTGRPASGNCADYPPIGYFVGAGEGLSPPCLSGARNRVPPSRPRSRRNKSSRVSINAGDVMEVITDHLTLN